MPEPRSRSSFITRAPPSVAICSTRAPGMPASGVELAVYEATTSRDAIKTTEHFALLDADNQMLAVNEEALRRGAAAATDEMKK